MPVDQEPLLPGRPRRCPRLSSPHRLITFQHNKRGKEKGVRVFGGGGAAGKGQHVIS